jgi:hypothetical protein
MSAKDPNDPNWLMRDPPQPPSPPSRLMSGDTEVANAIHHIADLLRAVAPALREAASVGKTSVLFDPLIRSSELSAVDADLLCETLAGELQPPRKGQPRLKASEVDFRCDAIEAVKKVIGDRKAKGEPGPHQRAAVTIVANRIGRDEEDLYLWLRMPKVLAEKMAQRRKVAEEMAKRRNNAALKKAKIIP